MLHESDFTFESRDGFREHADWMASFDWVESNEIQLQESL